MGGVGGVDSVGRKFAWVLWVTWVYKVLAWVKKIGVGGVGPWNCFIEKILLKILQILQENIYAGVSS